MRALFDTNIFISYLLPSKEEGAIQSIIRSAFSGEFTLLVPEEVAREFHRVVSTKKYLAEKISVDEAQELMEDITQIAELIPSIEATIPRFTRDRKDDYLIAHAFVAEADYLVTGDDDLLALGSIETIKIVTATQFKIALEEERLLETEK